MTSFWYTLANVMVSEAVVQQRLDRFNQGIKILRGIVNGLAIVFALALLSPAFHDLAASRANLFVFHTLAAFGALIVIVSLLSLAPELRIVMACVLQILSALCQLAALLVSVDVAFNAVGPVWTIVSLAVCIFPVYPLAIAASVLNTMNLNAQILIVYGVLWLGSYFLSQHWIKVRRKAELPASQ